MHLHVVPIIQYHERTDPEGRTTEPRFYLETSGAARGGRLAHDSPVESPGSLQRLDVLFECPVFAPGTCDNHERTRPLQ